MHSLNLEEDLLVHDAATLVTLVHLAGREASGTIEATSMRLTCLAKVETGQSVTVLICLGSADRGSGVSERSRQRPQRLSAVTYAEATTIASALRRTKSERALLNMVGWCGECAFASERG